MPGSRLASGLTSIEGQWTERGVIMTISKAIDILTHMTKSENVSSLEDCIDALKLGSEALKFKHEWYMGRFFPNDYLLPGEIEE